MVFGWVLIYSATLARTLDEEICRYVWLSHKLVASYNLSRTSEGNKSILYLRRFSKGKRKVRVVNNNHEDEEKYNLLYIIPLPVFMQLNPHAPA